MKYLKIALVVMLLMGSIQLTRAETVALTVPITLLQQLPPPPPRPPLPFARRHHYYRHHRRSGLRLHIHLPPPPPRPPLPR
ncbi:hypothetical protein HDF19_19540 [Mucilaginibacter sp. E4BP6]|uniref:hypothetical protein n=1 Tax=Mucilaginibacter sp. E4BP6 TaxID=2723089 RepID=UPI0015C75167|nr:hypothetical protein [Mucilaginibacter sp. E4BP6]NYE67182.1 hypothetical protein [Mucilaginibacter sp. E4BP6]